MMLREMLLNRVRWRDFVRSSRNKPRIFQRDDRFARQHAHHFQVPDVERAFLRTLHGHGADGPLVEQQRHSAEAALMRILRFQAQFAHFFGVIFADQEGLARAHQVFDDRSWPPKGRDLFGSSFAVAHFDFKSDFVAGRIVQRNAEMIHVEQALHFVQNGFKQRVRIQRGAQRAADFVEHVKLLRAARGLLDQIAIFDGHADLMAQRQQQAQFRRGKTAAIGVPRNNTPKACSLACRLIPTTVRKCWLMASCRKRRKASSLSRAAQEASRPRSRKTTNPPRRATRSTR